MRARLHACVLLLQTLHTWRAWGEEDPHDIDLEPQHVDSHEYNNGCMLTDLLIEAVREATWTVSMEATATASVTSGGMNRTGVFLTSCDYKCLKRMLAPFLTSIENNRDGNFAKHIIVV